MNRRDALKVGLQAAAVSALSGVKAMAQKGGDTMWVNPAVGADTYTGDKASPLRTLGEAARRVTNSAGTGAMTVILSEGIYSIDESVSFNPERRVFSKKDRLTIRAEVLPDDEAWDTGRMPTLIFTMPLTTTFRGKMDPTGGAALGLLIETSHVTIQGLKILGMPVVETPKPGLLRRVYPIVRLDQTMDDLEIAQCLFPGDVVTAPDHVCALINGTGLIVHHCVFYGTKISIVFWVGAGTGHAMRNCVCYDLYGSGLWTTGCANDFDFRNNVIANCNYAWTFQSMASARQDFQGGGGRQLGASPNPPPGTHYKVIDSYFAANRRLTGTGTGARLEYADYDASFLEMVGTKVTDEPVELEFDQTKRNYLHPVAGSQAAKIGAGLFLRSLKI